MKRREFLAMSLAIPAFGADERTDILNRIKAPMFPEREFDISKFGAVEGGKKDSTEALAKAIAACAAAGGGRVVVPEEQRRSARDEECDAAV
jgi:polygalacturonase